MERYEAPDPDDEERKRLARRVASRLPGGRAWYGLLRAGGPRRLSWAETVRAGRDEPGEQPSEEEIALWHGRKRRSLSEPIDWSAEQPDVPEPDLGQDR